MANIVFLSHCLLNNLSKVEPFENRNKELISFLLKNKVEIVQMPCPEYTLYGGRRFGQVKEQYDTPFFKKHCKNISESMVDQMNEYIRNGHNIIGIFAIKGSPTCGYLHTVSGPSWGGEINNRTQELLNNTFLVKESGIFIEELLKILPEKLKIFEVDEENIEDTIRQYLELMK